MTLFEETTRVPLIVKVPWLKTPPARSSAIVELVDVLPTVADLAGLSLPESETFDGRSFFDVLSGNEETFRSSAMTCYPRKVKDPTKPWANNDPIHDNRTKFTHMGYSIRTDEFRYTEWYTWNVTRLAANMNDIVARELYDHRDTPSFPTNYSAVENENFADDPIFNETTAWLSALLRQRVLSQ